MASKSINSSTFKKFVIPLTVFGGIACMLNQNASAQSAKISEAVVQANRPFTNPDMMQPTIDEKVFTFTDVGAKIPNYTPGRQWGTQGAPLTEMQNPLPAELSIKGYSVPQSFAMSLVGQGDERKLARRATPRQRSCRTQRQADCHELG